MEYRYGKEIKMLCCSKSSRCLLFWILLVVVVGVIRMGGGPLNTLFSRGLETWTASADLNGVNEQDSFPTTDDLWSYPSSNDPPQSTGPLHFFNKEVVRSPQEILGSQWMKRLRYLLRTVNSAGQISITFANFGYIESLLNWLIVAQVKVKPPIMNVIVVCLDEDVFRILNERDIPSVLISPNSVTRNVSKLQEKNFSHTVWVMRFVIYRLINYFGYDVVSYDTDAIIMKNPQPMFDEHRNSDIVSSAGSFPFKLGRMWGFTACMGVVMFRSSPRTGKCMHKSLTVI